MVSGSFSLVIFSCIFILQNLGYNIYYVNLSLRSCTPFVLIRPRGQMYPVSWRFATCASSGHQNIILPDARASVYTVRSRVFAS